MNAEQIPQNNFGMLAEESRHPEKQTPRKADCSLQKEVGQSIKDKNRVRRVRAEDPSQGGSCEEVSKHRETLSLVDLYGVLETQRATYLGGKNPQIRRLTASPSGELEQTLKSATSMWGLHCLG